MTIISKCFLCWLLGHEWWLRSFKESVDEKGIKHRDILFTEISNCDRCGEVNPRFVK